MTLLINTLFLCNQQKSDKKPKLWDSLRLQIAKIKKLIHLTNQNCNNVYLLCVFIVMGYIFLDVIIFMYHVYNSTTRIRIIFMQVLLEL